MAFLEVKNLKKNYKMQVLKGVSFDLEKGDVLSIIGSSGGGKTTLLRCLTFLESPNSGEIDLNGEKLYSGDGTAKETADSIRAKRLHFGLVFQGFNLFPHYNVLTNVKIGAELLAKEQLKAEYKSIDKQYAKVTKTPDKDAKAKIAEAKNALELALFRIKCKYVGVENKYPRKSATQDARLEYARTVAMLDGDNKRLAKLNASYSMLTMVERNAHKLLERVGLEDRAYAYPCELSGGMQQRVAIARALALHPDILCFDEPTSALDPELTGEVLKVIKGLKSGDTTMIIVTHEMDFAKNVSDKVMFISDGIIEEIGTPKQIFENPQSDKTKAFLRKSMEEI